MTFCHDGVTGAELASPLVSEIVLASELDAPAAEVWAHASTMDGVNLELMPLVRMHVPRQARGKGIADAPLGEVAFHSWLLAFGVVPFDRHALRLVAIDDGRGFAEESSSLLQRVWRHERTIAPRDGGCVVSDRVGVEPRLALAEPFAAAMVRAIFRHRHRRLQRRFGGRFVG